LLVCFALTYPIPSIAFADSPSHVIWGRKAVARQLYGEMGVPEKDEEEMLASRREEAAAKKNEGEIGDEFDAEEGTIESVEREMERVRGLSTHEETRRKFLNAVDEGWHVEATAEPREGGKEEELTPLEQKLRTLLVPKIHFQDMPLRGAVDLLAEISEKLDDGAIDGKKGINVILLDDPGEEMRVHFTLRNVPLERVLEILARSVGFDYETDGDAVLLGSPEKNSARLRTQFFPISRATIIRMTNLREGNGTRNGGSGDGDQIGREERLLREFLQNSGADFQGISGASLAFDGSELIVTQTPRNLRQISILLRRYGRTRQVEIETKFIEVQQGVLDELQFRWTLSNTSGRRSAATGREVGDNLRTLSQAFSAPNGTHGEGSIVLAPSELSPIPRTISIPNQPPSMPNGTNLGQSSVPLLDVLGVIGGAQVGCVLRALEQETGSDLMSAPRVTVLSGKTAEIVVAQEFRYPEEYDEIQSSVGTGSTLSSSTSAGVTITAGTPRNFKTRNIGVEMAVTPIVEADNRISLQLEPAVTEFDGFVEYGGTSLAVSGGATVTVPSGFYQPIFSTRRIRTEVTIDDGATVVMGGLTREEVRDVHDRVPILGRLPLVGRLFRSHGRSTQKRNLLIFVTAKLVDPHGFDGLEGEIVRQMPEKPVARPRRASAQRGRGFR
jgi:general secretion pathway protein D